MKKNYSKKQGLPATVVCGIPVVRQRSIIFLNSKKTIKRIAIRICPYCQTKNVTESHRCFKSKWLTTPPSSTPSQSSQNRKGSCYQFQQRSPHSSPTFQQHVRDHALNNVCYSHCKYCTLHPSNKKIVRQTKDSANKILAIKKNELEEKRKNDEGKNRVRNILSRPLSVHLPPMKIDYSYNGSTLSTTSPNDQNRMKPCIVKPIKSAKLESGKMNH